AEYGNVLIQVERFQQQFPGAPAIVHISELGGKTVYRVILGAFSTIDEARRLHEQVKAAGISSFPVDLSKMA
ncbi:SPOR domain-containing protein, partial [Arthrospira platensis SPKY1]|nr:SPOR domain-containing protein [Arthrospira platensis SPKY1]